MQQDDEPTASDAIDIVNVEDSESEFDSDSSSILATTPQFNREATKAIQQRKMTYYNIRTPGFNTPLHENSRLYVNSVLFGDSH
ncbi:hypothetical protein AB6A40_005218 [Gnathostoma spinigerum]|uniref:Uncharacterized protein n=1 Tax=Gnathostoma spinigerum TaxID=75299 RepID=A0ABD6EET3_9BILA